MNKHRFHRFALTAALIASALLSGCLSEEKDPSAISDAGKLSGKYYAASLGNLALQIQNELVTDTKWFSGSRTLELPLEEMGIPIAELSVPVRSYACPLGGDKKVFQITWLDGSNSAGKFTLKGIGTDISMMSAALRERAGSQNVGTYKLGALSMADGTTQGIPANCGALPIPEGSPIVAFTIDRPALPAMEMSRTEYQALACENNQRGTMVQKRTVTYKKDGNIDVGNWRNDDMGRCIDNVDVSITSRSASEEQAAANLNNFANIGLKDLLERQLKMGCINITVASSVTRDKTIDTCVQSNFSGKTALASTAGSDEQDTRTLSCAGTFSSPSTGFSNISGATADQTWRSGTAILTRNTGMKDLSDQSAEQGNRQLWVGSSDAGALTCTGDETVTISCASIQNAPGANPPALTPLGPGGPRYTGTTSTWGVIWNKVDMINSAYFTGTYQENPNGTMVVRRNIAATQWQNANTMTPKIDPASNWTVVSNQCAWVTRTLDGDGCPMNYNAAHQGNWTPSYNGYTGQTVIGFNNTNSSPPGWVYTSARNQFPYNDWPYHTEAESAGYTGQTSHMWIGPYYKRWNVGGKQVTLFNTDGIMMRSEPRIVGDRIVVQPAGFSNAMHCGNDDSVRTTVQAYVMTGPTNAWSGYWITIGATVRTYREWYGYSYETGTWSNAVTSYYPDQGSWAGGYAVIDQRYEPWSFQSCMQSAPWSCSSGEGAGCWPDYGGCCLEAVNRGIYPGECYGGGGGGYETYN